MGNKDSSPPPQPDYTNAAIATASGNADAARIAAKANRVNQYTPYGSLTYSQSPNDQDVWSSRVELNPTGQTLQNLQDQQSITYGKLANQGLDYVQNSLNTGFDQSKLPTVRQTAVAPGQTGQNAIFSRLAPQYDRLQSQLDTQLANQGITRGSEAYNAEKENFAKGRNDAYTQAALQGIALDNDARSQDLQGRQQAIQEQNYYTNAPLNMVNALRTGSQVTNPSFTSVPQQSTVSGPDFLGATQAGYQGAVNNYNASQAQQNNFMNGLFGIGLGAAGLPIAGGGSLGGNAIRGFFR